MTLHGATDAWCGGLRPLHRELQPGERVGGRVGGRVRRGFFTNYPHLLPSFKLPTRLLPLDVHVHQQRGYIGIAPIELGMGVFLESGETHDYHYTNTALEVEPRRFPAWRRRKSPGAAPSPFASTSATGQPTMRAAASGIARVPFHPSITSPQTAVLPRIKPSAARSLKSRK